MKLIVDLLGADNGPEELVKGCLKAIEENKDLEIIAYAKEGQIDNIASKVSRLSVVHCKDEILANDSTISVIRRKESSLIMAMNETSLNQSIDGIISAGSTAAFVTSSIFILKRMENVSRPSLMIDLPGINGKSTTMLDLGANIELNEQQFIELSHITSKYVQKTRNISNPRLSLLNIGEESKKGTKLLQSTNLKLSQEKDINFIGNIESRYLINNDSDIIISDGYSGNIALKAIEGMGVSIFDVIKKSQKDSLRNKIGLLLLKPVFKKLYKELDYNNYGGAMLIGVEKLAIKAHGSSDSHTFYSAICQFININKSGFIKKEK